MKKSEETRERLEKGYQELKTKKVLAIILLFVVSVVFVFISFSIGSSNIPFNDVMGSIIGTNKDPFENTIVWELRFPRIVMAIVGGIALGLAGASLQGVMRNPLVSPFTLGISSGAALGAGLAIVLNISFFGLTEYVIVLNAFIFALIASFMILGVGRLRGVTPESFILAGIALTFLFGAVTSSLTYIASDAQITELVYWGFGSLSRPIKEQALICSGILLIFAPFLVMWSWKLNAVSIGGDEVAKSLGVDPARIRVNVMIVSSVITAAVISFTGLIAFVGLVAPHISRLLVGGDNRYLLPTTALMGTCLLIISDTIGRTILAPTIIPVGIMLSFIGAPFFLYLLLFKRRQSW
jgi:iron complex transport system permease protein